MAFCGQAVRAASVRPGEKPQVNISFPFDEMLIRANVPVFGSAYMRTEQEQLKKWYLEFGAGRSPSTWTRIKESDKAISSDSDPYPQGKVEWNVHKEPPGNLTNWAVGLASYNYQNWGKNLNGLYTLRLVAESESGEIAETRRTAIVGEAVIRVYGGTGISADLKCRLLIPPFSFDGHQGKVVAVVKQVPPAQIGSCKTITGVEEVSPLTDKIYETTDGFRLASAIYRIYPNGIQTEPPSSLEIDFDPEEFSVPGSKMAVGEPMLYQWNALANLWEPLRTRWFGPTAKANVTSLSPATSYVVLMKRVRPISAADIKWNATSALSGFWEGVTTPHTTVKVTSVDRETGETTSDENGRFKLSYFLRPGTNSYRFEFLPLEGKALSFDTELTQKSGSLPLPNTPTLSMVGNSTLADHGKVLIFCQDAGLSDPAIKEKRSILVQARDHHFSRKFTVELAELLPGSGNFIGSVTMPGEDATSQTDSIPTTPLPPSLADGDKMVFSVGASSLELNIKDSEPPKATISSSTHPSLLFVSPSTGGVLKGARLHSHSDITLVDNAWKLSGIQGQGPSARIVKWPVDSFSVSAWPFISFTYKIYNPAHWQVILRSQAKIASFHLGTPNAYFPAYGVTEPLIADGNWHHWQRNLGEGKFTQIDSVSFGSWINTGPILPADVTTLTDSNNKTTSYAHTEGGYNKQIEDALGYSVFFYKNSQHLTTIMTDRRGKTSLFAYDKDNTDPLSQGNLLSRTNPLGKTWRYTWDSERNLTQIKDPLDHEFNLTYDTKGNPLTVENGLGQTVLTNTYTARGELATTKDGLNNTRSFQYNTNGLLTKVTDATGKDWLFGYDNAGNLLTFENPNGKIWTTTFNGFYKPATSEDPLGNRTVYTYDEMANLTKVEDANNNEVEIGYDLLQRVTGIKDGLGNRIDFTHDAESPCKNTNKKNKGNNKNKSPKEIKPKTKTPHIRKFLKGRRFCNNSHKILIAVCV